MAKHELAREYVDGGAERSLIRALSETPELYWELDLTPGVFAEHPDTYDALSTAIEKEQAPPDVPGEWPAATDAASDAAAVTGVQTCALPISELA